MVNSESTSKPPLRCFHGQYRSVEAGSTQLYFEVTILLGSVSFTSCLSFISFLDILWLVFEIIWIIVLFTLYCTL